MTLDSEITQLAGIGPAVAQKFATLGVTTLAQLIDYLPRRYEDYSLLTGAGQLKPGPVTIKAKIEHLTGRYVRRGMHITEAIGRDSSGSVRLIWFNQPYRATAIKRDQAYYISGVYELSHQRFGIMKSQPRAGQ